MTERKLTITILGDPSSGKQALETVGQSAGTLEAKVGGLEGTFARVGAVAGGFLLGSAMTKAPGLLMDAARGAAEDEAATLRLEQALRNAGGSFDENVAKVNERIAAGQRLAFGDDDVRDSFQTLLAATGDVDEALRRQTAAMDLARGAGIPLETATRMLGKLNAENVEVFKKMGIVLGDNATEADALAAVQARFGQQARVYADSTAGQFERAQLQMGELQESIGAAVLPAMTALATFTAGTLVPAMQQFVDVVGPKLQELVVPAVSAIAAAFGFLADHSAPVLTAIAAIGAAIFAVMIPALTAWIAAEVVKTAALIASAAAFLAANAPLIAIGVAIALVVAAVILLVQQWDEVTARFPALGTASEAVRSALSSLGGWITASFVPAVMRIASAISEAVATAVAFVSANWPRIQSLLEPPMRAAALVIELVWANIQTAIRTAVGVIEGLVDVVVGLLTGDWSRAWGGAQQIVSSVFEGIKGAVRNAVTFIEGLAPLMLAAASALAKALLDGLKQVLSSTAGFAGDVASAVLSAVKAVVNGVIDQLNRALEFTINVPGGLPDIHVNPPDIPHLARGGIVIAGDNPSGIEAVVPLERAGEFGFGGRRAGTEVHQHFHFNGFVGSVDELLRQLQLAAQRAGRGGVLS